MQKNNLDELIHFISTQPNLDDYAKQQVLLRIQNLKSVKINILITGATGSGKSSTINALFKGNVAKVGQSPSPETIDIEKFTLDNIILWDSPGLGDTVEKDRQHAKNITQKLLETDENGDAIIDLVLVILDGSNRDFGTSIQLINEVVLPSIGNNTDRLLVAINQCDMALSGRHWDSDNHQPKEKLIQYLDEQVINVKQRILASTGVSIEPIYYSAGFKEDDEEQIPYNLSKLLMFIVKHTKPEKRVVYINDINPDAKMWSKDDELEDYQKETKKSIWQSIKDNATEGGKIGGEIGSIFGPAGRLIGTGIGLIGGAIVGFFL